MWDNPPLGVLASSPACIAGKVEAAKAIDRILQEDKKPVRTVEVPVYEYESDMA